MKATLVCALFFIFSAFTYSAHSQESAQMIPVEQFYQYDRKLPLNAEETKVKETDDFTRYHVTYDSVHEKKVTAILTVPRKGKPPYPVVIFQHGMSESKDNEQVQFGTRILLKEGYAVFSIDADYHGERAKDKNKKYALDMITKAQIYSMRDMFVQTAVDIRRGIDFLSKKDFIDKEKIGYAGVSMGGIIGVLVSALDIRIKAPVFIVAGGNFLTMIPLLGVVPDAGSIAGVFDPVHFIAKISPRPFLMLNGLQDASMEKGAKLLHEAAKDPKQIIWVEGDHIHVPLKEETIKHCVEFYKKNLK